MKDSIRNLPGGRLCALAVKALACGATATYEAIRNEQLRRDDWYLRQDVVAFMVRPKESIHDYHR